MTDEYKFISLQDFIKLAQQVVELYNKYTYTDSIVEISSKTEYISMVGSSHTRLVPYLVKRKRFMNSENELLRKYPCIILAETRQNGISSIHYSKEAGYIVPHMTKLVNDPQYRKIERTMYLLEN